MAMGTLVAYSALGATKVAVGCPVGEFPMVDGPSGQQALVVRRFAIDAGPLDETADVALTAREIDDERGATRLVGRAGHRGEDELVRAHAIRPVAASRDVRALNASTVELGILGDG